MITIGIRVTPKIVYFCIADVIEDTITIQIVDQIVIPKALESPDKLSYLRTSLYTLINEYKVDYAILRRMEDNSMKIDMFRANAEGVIQELISNCRVSRYAACKLSQLATLLQTKQENLKQYIGEKNNFYDITGWEKFKDEERESIICALAATELKEKGLYD